MIKRIFLGISLLVFSISNGYTQTIGTSPVKISMLLSANFGELRNNHFHSGIDIKIQGRVGEPLYSFDDGYISRISVSPVGYGNALYITHPETGYTTVYGHMDGFFDEAEEYLRKYQYENETFAADLTLPENTIRVKKGQYIGKGGNTGSSFGPHLHFEVRDTKTEEALNPLPFFQRYLSDNRSPQIQGIMIIPMENAGLVNSSAFKKKFPLVANKKTEKKSISTDITAWGEIGVAVKAYDYMDNVTNVFGPYIISLTVDGKQIFGSKMDKFAFSETRYLNSFVDYEDWRRNDSFYMKSYVEPGNKLRIYNNVVNRGIITINEEREYDLSYTLTDYFGNQTTFSFIIQGKKEMISKSVESNTQRMSYNQDNTYSRSDLEFKIPSGNLYTDLQFKYGIRNSMECVSPVYTLHQYETAALHDYCPLKIKVPENMLGEDISKYYIARVSGSRKIFNKSEYKGGWFEAKIRDFGDYAVVSDFTSPVITPVLPNKWGINGKINCKISDKDSGIKTFKALIDNKFYLLEYDAKNSLLSAKLDASRIQKNGEHTFILTVTDNCGNEAKYTTDFNW